MLQLCMIRGRVAFRMYMIVLQVVSSSRVRLLAVPYIHQYANPNPPAEAVYLIDVRFLTNHDASQKAIRCLPL